MLRTFIILSVLLFIHRTVWADRFSVLATKPLIFRYKNIDELLQPKVKDRALEIKFNPTAYSCTVMAQLVFFNTVHNDFADKISLRLANGGCQTITGNEPKNLSVTPIVLFRHPAGTGEPECIYYYDVVISPFTNFVNTGQYDFSILFTMTQP